MKLELISFATCPFVHRAGIVLREKGVPYEIEYIDLANKPEWFLRISPRSKVPVLVADGTPIFESTVINEYIDETHPPRLLPDDALERAVHRAWIEVANDLFLSHWKMHSATTDAELDAAIGATREILGRFERQIDGPLFAGERFGMVDVAVAPALYRLAILESSTSLRFFEATPKVAAWKDALVDRPSVREGAPADLGARITERLRAGSSPLSNRIEAAAVR